MKSLQELKESKNTNGLDVQVSKVGSNSYITLRNTKGVFLKSFSNYPVQKVQDFKKLVQDELSHLDWDLSNDDFTDEHLQTLIKFNNYIKIVNNKYTVQK
jgi:hypothetical protein